MLRTSEHIIKAMTGNWGAKPNLFSLKPIFHQKTGWHPTQPIFHWKLGLRLLPNAKKSTQKKRNVHGQRKKLASPNARDTNMLVFLALGDAKVLSFALGDAKVPDILRSGGI